MPKHRLILLFSFFAFQLGMAQQNSTWYFGKFAGMNFGVNGPVPLHDGAMEANEGSATICDDAGNLLFYTNGVTVYNKSHQVMLNGDGLSGNISTVQSSIIVPQPGTPNIFYVFTADAIEHSFANGYRYSIVDMSRDGGKGEVISKNNSLHSSGTERMTAARHADGLSVWLITNDNNSNIFRAWLIGCSGLQTTPVTSTVGEVLDDHILMNVGMMKVSPNGRQLCQTHFPDDATGFAANFFQLFDFDNITGVISNPRKIAVPNAVTSNCEYSPNSKLLYLGEPYIQKMLQVEATLPTTAAIEASAYEFATPGNSYHGIQLAPDLKIYLSQPSRLLAAILYPNVRGAGCAYREKYLDISEETASSAYVGLPSYINDLSYDGNNGFEYTIVDSCTGTVQFNGFSTMPGTLTWTWDFGDGNSSNLQNPLHTYTDIDQVRTVRLRIQSAGGCGWLDRSRKILPQGVLINAAFDYVARCDSGYVRFVNKSNFAPDTAVISYLWDFGDGNTSTLENPIHSFPATGGRYNVTLTVQTTTTCLNKTASVSLNLDALDIQAPADMEIDAGETVQLNVTGGGTSFQWTPLTGLSSSTIANPTVRPTMSTMYVITAFNDAGCKDVDSVFIKVRPVPGIYVPTGFTPNNDGKNDVHRPIISDEFTLLEFTIYNRWGEKIFTTSEKNVGWNGKINGITQDTGVYVWIVNAIDTRTNTKVNRKGTFVIIR